MFPVSSPESGHTDLQVVGSIKNCDDGLGFAGGAIKGALLQ